MLFQLLLNLKFQNLQSLQYYTKMYYRKTVNFEKNAVSTFS